jgi:threonine dehydratase
VKTDHRLVELDDVRDAAKRLEGVAVRTPLDASRALSRHVGGPVYAKCENLQRTGSFKIRGAYNRISRLTEQEKRAGVVCASAGNHAQGVALAATLLDVHSTVFMPAAASLPKVEATDRYGREVMLTGKDFGEAFAQTHDVTFVHPYDHLDVIAGQGTIGLEIDDAMEDIGTVVVPVGGGGLIAGVAATIKSCRPGVRVVGVQAKGAAAYPESLERGEPVTIEDMSTIADGIAANRPGDLTLEHVKKYVDEIVCVTDDAIAEAMVFAAERMKLVLEPAGVAGAAALLEDAGNIEPPVVVVFSGGNIDPLLLQRVIRFGLSSSGRYFAFQTRLADEPGALSGLLGLVAEVGANVVGVEHHREGIGMRLGEVAVALQVETRGRDHIEQVVQRLNASGYMVEPS